MCTKAARINRLLKKYIFQKPPGSAKKHGFSSRKLLTNYKHGVGKNKLA